MIFLTQADWVRFKGEGRHFHAGPSFFGPTGRSGPWTGIGSNRVQGSANRLKIAYMGIVLIAKGIFFFDAIAYLAGNSFIIASILERNAYKVMKINEKSKRAVGRMMGRGAGALPIYKVPEPCPLKFGGRRVEPGEFEFLEPAAGEEIEMLGIHVDETGLTLTGTFIEAIQEGIRNIQKEKGK